MCKYDTAKSGILGLALGTIVGASLGILFAPQSGEETREDIQKSTGKLLRKTQNKADELKDQVYLIISDIQAEINKLGRKLETGTRSEKRKIQVKIDDLNDQLDEMVKNAKKADIKVKKA